MTEIFECKIHVTLPPSSVTSFERTLLILLRFFSVFLPEFKKAPATTDRRGKLCDQRLVEEHYNTRGCSGSLV